MVSRLRSLSSLRTSAGAKGVWDTVNVSTKNRIAYQGEPGANSHIVAKEHYPDMEPLPCASFEEGFAAVRAGADLAMMPVENSTYGRVADIHQLLPESGLHIIGEHFVRVHANLLACRARSSKIKTALSHAAARAVRGFLKQHGIKPLVGADTAGAAREVAGAGRPSQAAIASQLAAEIYGLEVLAATSRTSTTTPRASWSCRREPSARRPATGRRSRPSSSASATSRPRSTRRWAASRPTAST